MLLELFDKKEVCLANTWYQKTPQHSALVEMKQEIGFVLVGKRTQSIYVM